MQKIAIIGANGRNAATWTAAFLQAGFSVRALVRDAARRPRSEGAVWVEFELNDPRTYRASLSGVDLFALITPAEPGQTDRELALVEAARESGVTRIVNLSVLGADLPSPISPFARWQAPVEAALRDCGLKYVTLRPNAYMQNILLQRGGIEAGAYVEPTGDAAISWIDVDDIAEVAVAVAKGDHDGEAIDLTGPKALGGKDVAAALSVVLGYPIAFVSPALSVFRRGLLDRGAPAWRADALGELYEAILSGRAHHLSAVTPSTERLLGHSARSVGDFMGRAFRDGKRSS
jgi:uncharacterized protein YbjT (DUF2867 family)